jgi:hypothetical protein
VSYVFTAEQICLQGLARGVWARRGQAKSVGLPFGEETVTENLLLDLALTYPGKVTIVPFSKPIEGKTGADWAWAFESADGAYNYPMMVQAKVLDALDRGYGEIPRNVGTSSVRQIDRLIDTADSFGFPAFYAFYNHLNDSTRVPSNCHSLDMTRSGPIPETWGVSIAPAENVRKVLNDVTFETHKAHSIPLHCLICSHGQGTPGSSGSPGRIAENFSLGAFSKMPGLPSGDPDAGGGMKKELHSIFRDALEAAEMGPENRAVWIDKLIDKYPTVAGVVVIRDGKRAHADGA